MKPYSIFYNETVLTFWITLVNRFVQHYWFINYVLNLLCIWTVEVVANCTHYQCGTAHAQIAGEGDGRQIRGKMRIRYSRRCEQRAGSFPPSELIYLVKNWDQRPTVLNTLTSCRVLNQAGNFMTRWLRITFSWNILNRRKGWYFSTLKSVWCQCGKGRCSIMLHYMYNITCTSLYHLI
jgi:hypothetical protein